MFQKFYPKSLINQKPNLEKLYQVHSVSKTEKAYLDGLEQKLGEKIIRQVKFGKWFLDGLLTNSNVIIEYDGPENHQSQKNQNKDLARDREFLKMGFQIYRLQWFEFEKNYQNYQKQLQKVVEFSARDISILIQLSKLKK
jgi:very-short-patch-repair endonuclease